MDKKSEGQIGKNDFIYIKVKRGAAERWLKRLKDITKESTSTPRGYRNLAVIEKKNQIIWQAARHLQRFLYPNELDQEDEFVIDGK